MSIRGHEHLARLQRAFPARLSEQVERAAGALRFSKYGVFDADVGDISIEGAPVHIPTRLGATVRASRSSALGLEERLILDALMTRHHDGFVRQRHLQGLLSEPRLHLVPFVLQLLGEYVVEIVEDIDEGTAGPPIEEYEHFLNENAHFLWLTGERMVSYWNCYYRHYAPKRRLYVGTKVIERMKSWRS